MADNEALRLAATSTRALSRRPKKPLTNQEVLPADVMSQGGDFKTVAKYQRTFRNSPNQDALHNMMPAPRGRGSASRGVPAPLPEVNEVAERVHNFERTYYSAKAASMPFTWLIQQDENDLAYLSDPEIAGTLLTELNENEEFRATVDKWNERLDRRTNEIMRERQNQDNLFNNLSNFVPIVGPAIAQGANLLGWTNPVGLEDPRKQAELDILGQAAPAQADWWGDFDDAALDFLGTAAEGIMQAATTIGAASLLGTSTLWRGLTAGKIDPLNIMLQSHNEKMETQRAEYVEILTAPEQTRVKRAREQFSEAWFEELTAQGQTQEFVTMGLGNPAVARALMETAANIVFDEDPALQNQVMLAQDEEMEGLIQELDENNFTIDGQVSSMIGWSGHNINNRIATYFTVFFSQDDISDFFTSDGYLDIHERAVAANFQPSKVIGIDGTMQGILFDFTAGGLFDPLNFVVGPAGRAMGISTAAQAARVARAPATRQLLRDSAMGVRSFFRDDLQQVALLEDFDTFGMYDEFVARSIGVDAVISERPWLSTPAGRITKEIPTDTILGSIPDDVIMLGRAEAASLRSSLGRDVTPGDLILSEPAILKYSQASGGFTMDPSDVGRLILAQEAGFGAFPVFGRVIDNLAPDVMRVMDEVTANPNDFFFHGRSTARNRPGGDEFTGGGLETSLTSASSYGDQMLVFRREDVLSRLSARDRAAVEAGSRIERLLPPGSTPTGRGNYVVTSMPQPVTRWMGDEFTRYQNPTPTRVPDTRLRRLDSTDDFALPKLLDDDYLYPQLKELMPQLEALTERLMARGGGQMVPQKTMLSRIFSNDVRAAFRAHNEIGPWALRYWTRQNVGVWLRTHGFGWEQEIRQNIFRMFGHDEQTANFWMRRLREEMRPDGTAPDLASLRLQIRQAADRVKYHEDNSGGVYDTLVPEPDDLDRFELAMAEEGVEDFTLRAAAAHNEAKATLARLRADETRAMLRHQRTRGVAAQRVIREMWDDYNRRYIATNPQWADHVGPDGLVPWDAITGGTRRPTSRSNLRTTGAIDQETNANSVIAQLMDEVGPSGEMVPLAPIDMIAASELGGAKWLQWQRTRFGQNVRNTGNLLDRLWKIDKVFRISTAMTVSFDELIRIFNQYGAPAVLQWVEDRVMFTAARAKALIGDRAPSAGMADAVDGTRAIFHNKRWNQRMQRLNEYPEFYKHIERQYYEFFEDSWDDIAPGEAEWLPAMDMWTSNLLQQDGFRAYLRGREEFAKYWRSEEAGFLRNQTAFDWGDGRTRLATEDEAWGGFDFLMNRVFLGKVRGGRTEAVRKAFIDGANRIAAGEQGVTIAPSVLREMQMPVRGIKNLAPDTPLAGRLSNKFFEDLFMAPTNYRRGFLAELSRKYETRRLNELYQSQGLQIVPDWKIDSVLPDFNVRNTAIFGLPEALEQMLFDRGYVTTGTIARMAERKAMSDMEHIMYTWHMTSRAGRSPALRAAFPFGKPYFDMWAHYGREMLTRPALRGYINRSNFGNLANKALDRFPINPKPASLISRIAATDFNADKQNADFSPLLFLPKEGESALMSVLPGVGLLPMWMMDFIVSNVHDPFEEPLEYQALVESISNWIPAFGFQQTGLAGRALGGGLLASGFKAAIDGLMMGARRSFHEPLSLIGDIQNEIQTNRSIKALLADPEEWDALVNAREDQLPALFDALMGDAYGSGAGSHLADIASRWFVPVDFDFDTSDDDVRDVWLEAAVKFPQLQPRNFNRNAEEEVLKEHADDIRRLFFDLPATERDKLLVQYPQLAVNMVSGWEWTDKAEDEFPTIASVPYRTVGGQEGLARHQSYIRNDYVRPLSPAALMARIIGTVFDARVSLATQLYTDQANKVNDYMWENVIPDRGKAFFDQLVADGVVDASSGREVWQNFSAYEDKIEAAVGPTSLPASMTAWGTSWRGLEDDAFSQRFREIELGFDWAEFTPEIQERAAILGIELEVGMTGEQFVSQIHDLIRQNVEGSPLPSFVNQEYVSYRDARSAVANAGRENLLRLVAGSGGDPGFKMDVQDFLDYADRTSRLRGENGLVDPERARNVVDQYKQLMTANPDLQFSWEDTWRQTFESNYGPLDYEYPQPPTLDTENFTNTYRPFIWEVVDGDSLIVSTEPSAPWLDLPGSRFDILSGGAPQRHAVRLLGISAPELSQEEGKQWLDQLTDAIMEAKRNGTPIYLVRDNDTTGNRNVDFFGRELAWLFIGDTPYYHPETITPGS